MNKSEKYVLKSRFKLNFGSKIKQLRMENYLSQQQLAELCFVSESYISYIENGERWPKPQILNGLVTALNFDLNHFLKENTQLINNDLKILHEKRAFSHWIFNVPSGDYTLDDIKKITNKEITTIRNIMNRLKCPYVQIKGERRPKFLYQWRNKKSNKK